MRVARLTQTPWRTVYHEWPAGLVLALAVVLLQDDRDRARARELERRELARLMAIAHHAPAQLEQLPPVDRPTRAAVRADLASAAARLAAAAPELPEG